MLTDSSLGGNSMQKKFFTAIAGVMALVMIHLGGGVVANNVQSSDPIVMGVAQAFSPDTAEGGFSPCATD